MGSMYWVHEHCGMRHLPAFAREWLFLDGSCAWSMWWQRLQFIYKRKFIKYLTFGLWNWF